MSAPAPGAPLCGNVHPVSGSACGLPRRHDGWHRVERGSFSIEWPASTTTPADRTSRRRPPAKLARKAVPPAVRTAEPRSVLSEGDGQGDGAREAVADLLGPRVMGVGPYGQAVADDARERLHGLLVEAYRRGVRREIGDAAYEARRECDVCFGRAGAECTCQVWCGDCRCEGSDPRLGRAYEAGRADDRAALAGEQSPGGAS